MIKLGNLDISAFKVGSADTKVYLGNTLLYPTTPPAFQGKWLATYSDSSTTSAECDSSSAITNNEITKSNLVSVEIGDCVTSIGNQAFYMCSGITSINIPNSVTSIGNQAFQYCGSLTSCTIGSGVTTIGYNAFSNCNSLTSIDIPNSVTSIGSSAFKYCSSLTSCTIGSGVTSIGNSAFGNCTRLTSINIPNSVTTIGNSTFSNCSSLTSCTIGNMVTSIGDLAFDFCSSLTSIDIPNSVTSIGEYAFEECSSLTSIVCNATTPPTLGSGAFSDTNDCPIYVPAASVNAYKSATNWSTYASRIQAIPSPSFQGKWLATYADSSTTSAECDASSAITSGEITKTNLVSVEIGDCVTSIGDSSFYRCSSLTSVIIPNSVASINRRAFSTCVGITNIEIPSSVTYIGTQAFYNCTSLASITINATTPPTLDNQAIYGTTCPIYVPYASVSTYQTASGWSAYASRIQAIS